MLLSVSQGFNSVEINASFYRFPAESWVKNWQNKSPKDFTFSIKVHRSITHYNRLKGKRSVELWQRFRRTLEPIIEKIDFWLFQMPPNYNYNQENMDRIRSFFKDRSRPVKKDNSNNGKLDSRMFIGTIMIMVILSFSNNRFYSMLCKRRPQCTEVLLIQTAACQA
jgi:uncharacterized protein YecE (DUF72 family)